MSSQYEKIFDLLPKERMKTYFLATNCKTLSIKLYDINSEVGGLFKLPLEYFEVMIRTAAQQAFLATYGKNWLENNTLHYMLSQQNREKIQSSIKKYKHNSGFLPIDNVVADLSLGFWQELFSKKFVDRVWKKQFETVFTNFDRSKTIAEHIAIIHTCIDNIRELRNRAFHHEPIFKRNLRKDIKQIHDVLNRYSDELYHHVVSQEKVSILIDYSIVFPLLNDNNKQQYLVLKDEIVVSNTDLDKKLAKLDKMALAMLLKK
nr:Abi family protein [uncultured Moraxella sp.]